MKVSSILSVATLAVSALASPILGASGIVSGVVDKVGTPEDSGDIITLLEGAVKGVKGHTSSMSMGSLSPR